MNGYSYTCGSCGAELVLNNENQMITKCLYCGNSIAITKKEYNELNIKKIIPFSLDSDDVIRKYGNKIFNRIVDAKKVYVPVKYCSFDFDYLIYYEYVIRDDDGNRYVNEEELFDGRVDNKPAFGSSKIDSVEGAYLLDANSRVDYDPVLLKDVSIECAYFDDEEQIKRKIEVSIANYFRKKTGHSINTLYAENYFITDLQIDNYTTLIPVYILKTKNGTIKKVPGVPVSENKSSKVTNFIFAFIIVSLVIVFALNIYSAIRGGPMFNPETFFVIFAFFPFVAIFTLCLMVIVSHRKNKDIEENGYICRRYSMGDKRSKLNLKRR